MQNQQINIPLPIHLDDGEFLGDEPPKNETFSSQGKPYASRQVEQGYARFLTAQKNELFDGKEHPMVEITTSSGKRYTYRNASVVINLDPPGIIVRYRG